MVCKGTINTSLDMCFDLNLTALFINKSYIEFRDMSYHVRPLIYSWDTCAGAVIVLVTYLLVYVFDHLVLEQIRLSHRFSYILISIRI